ncbi:MAG: nuclear transport factor 2 family protein [Myxococcales bacterium]|nr:nuclear transport factor 2 family protein [Myxococcales bacterium]
MADDLQDRVQRLEDILEIQQLFIDYGHHLDAGDFEAYASLFANEGEVLLGPLGRAKGRDQIRSLMETALDGAVGTSFHVISSPMIALRGDTATSDVMWTVVHRKEDGHPSLSMIGRHRDELVREDGRWRFLKRRGFVDIPSAMS